MNILENTGSTTAVQKELALLNENDVLISEHITKLDKRLERLAYAMKNYPRVNTSVEDSMDLYGIALQKYTSVLENSIGIYEKTVRSLQKAKELSSEDIVLIFSIAEGFYNRIEAMQGQQTAMDDYLFKLQDMKLSYFDALKTKVAVKHLIKDIKSFIPVSKDYIYSLRKNASIFENIANDASKDIEDGYLEENSSEREDIEISTSEMLQRRLPDDIIVDNSLWASLELTFKCNLVASDSAALLNYEIRNQTGEYKGKGDGITLAITVYDKNDALLYVEDVFIEKKVLSRKKHASFFYIDADYVVNAARIEVDAYEE